MRAHLRYRQKGKTGGPDGYLHVYDCGPREVTDIYAGRSGYEGVTDIEIIETGREDTWTEIKKALKRESIEKPKKPPVISWK